LRHPRQQTGRPPAGGPCRPAGVCPGGTRHTTTTCRRPGGDRPVSVFLKTRAAAAYIAGTGPGELARTRATILLARLGACEDILPGGEGDVPPPSTACCAI